MTTPRRLELLHWNDVHGRFAGLARLSARARAVRDAADHPVLVLDGGDVEEGSVRVSALTFGVAGWRLLGAAGVDAAVAGNGGLLRYGPAVLPEYAAGLGSPPLVCDLEAADGRTPDGAAPSVLLQAGDLSVGVVGITDYFHQYADFGLSERPRSTAVRREAHDLRARGADVVVLLSHAGVDADRAISWNLRGLVDVIVGGHTHHLLDGGDLDHGVPIAQAGCFAEQLGRVLLEVDADGVRVVDLSVEAVPEDAATDPAVLAELAACERDLGDWLAEPVAELSAPVPHEGPDNPVGRLVVEALLAQAPADLGVLIDAHCEAGLPAGTITRDHVWGVTSSPGNLSTATLTGAEVRRMLVRGRSEEFVTGRPRTFRGRPYGPLQYVGAEVRGEEIHVAGAPLDDDRTYTVTGSDLELSVYGTLVERTPADFTCETTRILPQILESYLRTLDAG